jgi:hypothetical protein
MTAPLSGSLLAAAAWFSIAVLSLVPAGNAFFARKSAFPLGTLAGLALIALGLSQRMVLAESGDTPGSFLLAPGSGAQPGMKVR